MDWLSYWLSLQKPKEEMAHKLIKTPEWLMKGGKKPNERNPTDKKRLGSKKKRMRADDKITQDDIDRLGSFINADQYSPFRFP